MERLEKNNFPFLGRASSPFEHFPSIHTAERLISDVNLVAELRRMGYEKDEMCAHGFRAIASTLLNELGYDADYIEKQLAQ